VLFQIMIHVAGFILVALLVSILAESLRTATSRLAEEKERAKQFVALTDHVVRSVSAGIVATDLEGTVLQVNPAAAQILSLGDPESAFGEQLEEIMPLKEQNWGLLRARARNRTTLRVEGHLATTGASLGLTLGPLQDERESFVGYIINFQDLTEMEVEAERQRTQERMAAVGEMAARMAHEIKNPLASISGSAQVLASSSAADETDRRLLGIVVDESRRLSSILDGFLDYVRPRASTLCECNLGSLLEDCTELLRGSHELGDKHTVSLEAPHELRVLGNEHQLRQVFWNLSRNALQAMPDGGELRITAERSQGSVILRWSDTGVGMSEEIRKTALEPFVTSQPQGTGLGLAVTYATVEEHGGSIEISSEPGKGTTVTVQLPMSRGQ
jgi:two-component system sensor histidine kinase PilS (NtrC family)